MKVVDPLDDDFNQPGPPSEAKLNMLTERAKKRLPLFQPHDTPDDAEEHDDYLHLRSIHKALGLYLAHWKDKEHDDDAEIVFTELAPIIKADAGKPNRIAHQLPLPHSNTKTRTSKHVWRWHEVKRYIRRLMVMMAIRELSGRL